LLALHDMGGGGVGSVPRVDRRRSGEGGWGAEPRGPAQHGHGGSRPLRQEQIGPATRGAEAGREGMESHAVWFKQQDKNK
jgi:hypothetical protein